MKKNLIILVLFYSVSFAEITKYFDYETQKYGFKDEKQKIIVQPIFNDVYPFNEGLALVKIDSKYSFINENEKIIKYDFDFAYPFSEGLAVIKIDEKWGYINNVGKYIIEPKLDDAESFILGFAFIQINGKEQVINKNGEIMEIEDDEENDIKTNK